ncbi:hypothetical protein MUN81_09730 [Hymenobacter sp. 5317J-9]|uniref:hypothetical protein n=1 Tax=Hymenobacter sp. 5317J-9 TaxID=2932250 RepID=UPI001FD71BA8|nr:hypothetical protein [Hymenobacter sp. 5317J-9]UOQ99759.1 hypothetical protein MUN81_09730 [Hymenobacter sp. 5317J-9]
MASNLDYLDPALVPLEEKVDAYLETEKAIQRAIAVPQANASSTSQNEPAHSVEQLRQDLAHLEQEIIGMLPTRDEWLKVNLGYGPSRVGAWHIPGTSPERYELRVVH